ncbi:hypothetical protein DSO57_1025737 [Entomophthora muscae]|uniref:Uncharacterized protein n=1 Tax=Entomophthora muscae TaxID=34485 RepID=A0ACC2UN30_9FUNG|nr:hypothetical protein DSO57_1025737 [Entomophthora muscae]
MGFNSVDGFLYALLGLVAVSVVANMVLVWVATSVRDKGREVRLALALAGVDIVLAMLVMSNFILKLAKVSNMEMVCQIKGPLDFIFIFTSMALVSIISIERSSIAVSKRAAAGVWALLGLVTSIFLGLVCIEAIRKEFTVSASGLACAPVASKSPLSAALLLVLSSSLFVFLLMTVMSYLRILIILGEWGSTERKNEMFTPILRRKPVMHRILVIATIYFLLLAPCSLAILVESLNLIKEADLASTIVSLLLVTVSIANPCVILFAHTAIYRQLCFKLTNMFG